MNHRKVKMAVIGAGVMGSSHVAEIPNLPNAELVAVCDIIKERADQAAADSGAKPFYNYRKMLDKSGAEAVVIATPHYFHTPISIEAMQRGIHVLTEKPLAVHTLDGRKMIAVYEAAKMQKPDLQFAIMFQQRTYGFWQKIKAMIEDGELGRLVRTTWLITDWFRSQTYFNNGGWRATWKGEGGGVLLNQCPHNLDLFQWFVGVPKRVSGHAAIGKYHDIEVEDEVTGFFEYENGMVGHFVTTTAESPGTNRLEIVGEKGKLTFENGRLTFFRNEGSMLEFIRNSPSMWDRAPGEEEEIPYQHHDQPGHRIVLENFANAILSGEPLIAPAPEGIRSLMIGNAMMYATFLGRPVELPFDDAGYAAQIRKRARASTFQKTVQEAAPENINNSFNIPGGRK